MSTNLIKRWEVLETTHPIPEDIIKELTSFPPFFQKILYHRGIKNAVEATQFLECAAECGDPFEMKGMQETVDRLRWAITHQEMIVVYGDYDVDGVTSTALMVEVLTELGAVVDYFIPNRFDDGYGLSVDAIEKLVEKGAKVILTVDCGIRSFKEVKRAHELEIDLIISDHHTPMPSPSLDEMEAYAIVCPKQEGDQYPYKDLAGVGLAYKIAEALIESLHAPFLADNWLDLVALGMVADMVPLIEENRVLVRRGIKKMRLNPRPGVQSLAQVAGIRMIEESEPGFSGEVLVYSYLNINAGDIGFILGPRLNAAGRMETALDSLHLLLAKDLIEAGALSQKLDNLNMGRQNSTRKIQEEAEIRAKENGDGILMAFSPDFNVGVLGLAAARLADKYYRPAVVGKSDEEFTRASCRSIAEFNITTALDECKELLVQHGGHAMAAGFTVRTENLPELMTRLKEIAHRELGELDLRPTLRADAEIPLRKLAVNVQSAFMGWLEKLQPTGTGNPEAVFVSRNLRVKSKSLVGADKSHLKLKLLDGEQEFDAIGFRMGSSFRELSDHVDVMYIPEWNNFNGRTSLQLRLRDIKNAGTPD